MMYCKQCGTTATSDAKYCANCGAVLSVESSQEATENVIVSAEIPKDRKGWLHQNGWLYLAVLMLIGAYTAMLLPVLAGEYLPGQAGTTSVFCNWFFFYLLWKRRGSKPWHGGLIGAGFGIAAFFLAAAASGFVKASKPEAQLDKNPAIRALKDVDRQTYDVVLREFKEGIKNKQSENELTARTQPIIQAATLKYIPLASNDALVSYYRTQTRYVEIMSKARPDLCYDVAIARTKKPPSGLIADGHKEQEINALAELIRSGVRSQPQRPTVDPDAVLKAISARVKVKYGNNLENFGNALAAGIDKSKVCEEAVMFYNELFLLPTEQAAAVIRYLLTAS